MRERLSHINWTKVRKYESIIMPLALISIAPTLATYMSSELHSFLVFIGVFCIYAIRDYDSRLLIGAAILILTVSSVELAWGSESYANMLSILAYYFLVAGVLGSLVEYIRYPEAEGEVQPEHAGRTTSPSKKELKGNTGSKK